MIGSPAYLFSRIPDFRGRELVDLRAHGEISQLVSTVEHVVPDGEIDEGGEEDARPDGDVVAEDAEGVVLVSNPTPELEERMWLAYLYQ